jgi:hypothetical protein
MRQVDAEWPVKIEAIAIGTASPAPSSSKLHERTGQRGIFGFCKDHDKANRCHSLSARRISKPAVTKRCAAAGERRDLSPLETGTEHDNSRQQLDRLTLRRILRSEKAGNGHTFERRRQATQLRARLRRIPKAALA